MNEKKRETKRIEKATAKAFLSYYNQQEGTSYHVVENDAENDVAPDVRACDEQGKILKIEVRMTEDHQDDIKAALGRSEARSLEPLKRHVEEVHTGKADARDRVSELSGNVTDSLKKSLRDKLTMRYGRNTALVIRDTSGVEWDWDLVQSFEEIIESVLKELSKELNKELKNPYDRGIWIVSRSKDRVFRLALNTI